MIFEQHYAWGRAYRDGELVCARVHVTIGHDHRIGLTRAERSYLRARFVERLDESLCGELTTLIRRKGSAATRAAEALEPIDIVLNDPQGGRQRVTASLHPPLQRRGDLSEIEFTLREL